MAIKFKYYGLEFINMPRDERPYYCRFAVHDAKTGENIVEFYTNKSLEGMFVFDERTNTYRQIKGTCQYSLAGLGEKTVYNRLRIIAYETLAEKKKQTIEEEMAAYFASDDYRIIREQQEAEFDRLAQENEQEDQPHEYS